MIDKWISTFEELSSRTADQVGSKCANLGEMTRIGVPVPPGFGITTEAYSFFLNETKAGEKLDHYLSEFAQKPKSIAEYEELSQRLCQVIATKEMPKELKKSIAQAYKALAQKCGIPDIPVAVRSSGVAEDLSTAAFAGQYESYLNVKGEKELLDKVKECWASLFTARVISYQMRNNLPIIGALMGVIVQKVVNARCAGVVFSALPSTGDTSWIVIEGNWGTAESVVQGVVTPDKWYVSKKTLGIEERNITRKLKQFLLAETGTEETDIPLDKQSIPCLSDEEVVKIAELAKYVESQRGSPQDMEWVTDRNLSFPHNIFLVQTRPLTTLKMKGPTDQVVDLMLSQFSRRR